MDFNEVINMIGSYGMGIVCLAYFMIRDWKYQGIIQESLSQLNETTELIKDLILRGGER